MKPAVLLALSFVLYPLMSSAAASDYTAERAQRDGLEIIRLTDSAHRTVVSIVPSIGNNAFEMLVNGTNVLWFPFSSLTDFKTKPTLCGVPLLAPWANRLDEDGFWANGKHYSLNKELKNYRTDGHNHPIHGLLTYAAEWEVVKMSSDGGSAEVTSRLEFASQRDYMAQFPFAHTIYMTHRLRDGVLEVETRIENAAREPMPVSVGFHPYFRISDAPRNDWKVQIPAREHVVLSGELIPTGETKPNPHVGQIGLDGVTLDDVFSGLVRSEGNRAEFFVTGAKQRIAVLYGPKYQVAVVYAPPGRDFICFEPMSGPTNAFNLHHAGKYKELQSIPAGGKWTESFYIRPEHF